MGMHKHAAMGGNAGLTEAAVTHLQRFEQSWSSGKSRCDYKSKVCLRERKPSMRHQDRHRHRRQDAARHTAEDEFPQTRMAVATEHHQVGARIGGVGEDRRLYIDIAGREPLDLDGDAMAREVTAHVDARDLAALVTLTRDHDNFDALRPREKRD